MVPLIGEAEKSALNDYMESGGFLTEFRKTEEFENRLADFLGARHCIVVCNGTVSLTLAGMAVGISAGDEVIVPNYTMIASANSMRMLGAKPVFVDVEPNTLCMDIDLVRNAITSKTKAIMLVSANGRYPLAGWSAFEELGKQYGIPIIEDAAQSLGSYYPDGRHIGTAGSIGSISFSMPKIITTGQGGALFTNDDELAISIRKLKDFGRESGGVDIHPTLGFNFKFTDLQACVGLAQMDQLPDRVERKKEIWRRYKQGLENLDQVEIFDHNLDHTTPWFIDIKLDNRDELIEHLGPSGIGTRPMYPPISRQLSYQEPGEFPVASEVGRRGLWLPSFVQLSDEQIDLVCSEINKFFSEERS
jgi:perosamine synthetase